MIRKFSSYGPVSKKINYYVPREELVTRAYQQLIGEDPEEGGHFFTVWAPRQTGKSWVMREVMFRIYKEQKYDVAKINLEAIKDHNTGVVAANYIIEELNRILDKTIPELTDVKNFARIFVPEYFKRPLILILDEFDALEDITIQELVSRFRDIYLKRKDDTSTDSHNPFLLHGLALIGVRSVLGIQNQKGSPFNIQRSLFIPNLTYDEMKSMYDWYTQDSGQEVEKEVLDELYFETNGQPGLISWFGELLTETYNPGKDKPIDKRLWNIVYSEATAVLPNNTILNLISKAEEPESKPIVMELFRTDEKMYFRFDNKKMNYLYTNGGRRGPPRRRPGRSLPRRCRRFRGRSRVRHTAARRRSPSIARVRGRRRRQPGSSSRALVRFVSCVCVASARSQSSRRDGPAHAGFVKRGPSSIEMIP